MLSGQLSHALVSLPMAHLWLYSDLLRYIIHNCLASCFLMYCDTDSTEAWPMSSVSCLLWIFSAAVLVANMLVHTALCPISCGLTFAALRVRLTLVFLIMPVGPCIL